jgi:flagellar hook assembly protein FlgD
LKLLVGSTDFVQEQAGTVALAPDEFALMQNYPNPFNPETTIRYNLPRAATVSLKIFDLLGRHVRTLLDNESKNAGYFFVSWNGRDTAGMPVASGIYMYRITIKGQAIAKKMILMK